MSKRIVVRRTYAYNGITIGVFLGILIWLATKNTVIGVASGIGISIVAFIIIRVIENLLRKGIDTMVDGLAGVQDPYIDGEVQSNGQKHILEEKTNDKDWVCSRCGRRVPWYSVNCECGNTKMNSDKENH